MNLSGRPVTQEHLLRLLLIRQGRLKETPHMETVSEDFGHTPLRRSNSILPSDRFEEIEYGKWKRRLRDLKETVIRPFRFFWNTSVARTKNLIRMYQDQERSHSATKWTRLKMWWNKEGYLLRGAFLISLVITCFFAGMLWNFIKTTETYSQFTNIFDTQKNLVLNVYTPPNSPPVLLPKGWITPHIPLLDIQPDNITRGYFDCAIHPHNGMHRNVTIATLMNLFQKGCPPDDTCTCLAAGELGIGCSAIFLNHLDESTQKIVPTILLGPQIKEWSKKTINIRLTVGRETETIKRPADVVVEYWMQNAYRAREKFSMGEASCLLSAIEFNADFSLVL